jgi:hypothetical protein
MTPILWQPRIEVAAATQIMALAREQGFDGPDTVGRLWQWSVVTVVSSEWHLESPADKDEDEGPAEISDRPSFYA